eukprot:IDg20975t1
MVSLLTPGLEMDGMTSVASLPLVARAVHTPRIDASQSRRSSKRSNAHEREQKHAKSDLRDEAQTRAEGNSLARK